MADKLKKILSSIMVVLLLMMCLYPCRRILERKSSRFKYDPFFSRAKDIDVLFMGSSHVINGIYPMELSKRRVKPQSTIVVCGIQAPFSRVSGAFFYCISRFFHICACAPLSAGNQCIP